MLPCHLTLNAIAWCPVTPLVCQPSGYVIGNDADAKRAYMLVNQCRRLGSANLIVTCHEAQHFPTLNRLSKTSIPASGLYDVALEHPPFFSIVDCHCQCLLQSP